MTSEQWRIFFTIASKHIRGTLTSRPLEGMEIGAAIHRVSYCAWTTFERLGFDTIYWKAGLPEESDLLADHVRDGGAWGQPFLYAEIAHLIIPSSYLEEVYVDDAYVQWTHKQDIAGLGRLLVDREIPHRQHPTFLELKLY
jgi:hypothetical protein